ncbi:endolytic transglycosylase MltG [Streptomyces sp. NPDC006529]|uniref:endolytic transglycosylase MltG n=1 Tax=Streptomyces sp. NPDC006529 TaxID=3157177 RepID=UPI0033A8F069
MTEYGRGSGPEPWHPEDPLYGDPAWAHQTQQGQLPHDVGRQQYPQEPQYHGQPPQPQYQQPQQQYAAHPQHPQQQYPAEYQGYAPEHPQQQQQYAQQPQQQQPVYDGGPPVQEVWDTGQGQQAVPYGVDPYAQQPVPYPGEAPDDYGTDRAYPPPQPPGRRHLVPEPSTEWQDESAEPQDEEDGSFLAAGGGGEDEPPTGRRGRGKGKDDKNKGSRRAGSACLIAALVIVGAVGGVGYYGFSYIKAKLGMAEDYSGEGTTAVDVEIPKGATLGQMGAILEKAGVVASAQAFVNAAQQNPKGSGIQPGLYPLRKQMSAKSVVDIMSDPSKLNVIIVAEGLRNVKVYETIDKKLGLQEGTTQELAKREVKTLGLPAWAEDGKGLKDPLEGFLYPARYDVTTGITPQDLLKKMVKNATDKYAALGIEGKAKDLGLKNPLEVVTVASLVQAEGNKHEDYRKMAAVIYNRLKPSNTVTNQKLEFDSTINYIKGTSNINVSREETRSIDDPYNTYKNRGLPPGAISNPGADALNAVLNPDKDGWMFFVSVDGNKTTFTKTLAEHNKLVEEFNTRQAEKKQQQSGG